jgi:TetR/AcrR family transcriptional repressor of nem operon
MSKGERTRKMILERSAPLFNQQGYFGVSLGDIMHATDLEKGGIYNHFTSKEELAIESFNYVWNLVRQHMGQAIEGKKHAAERLYAYASAFLGLADGSILPGGCPILNTAIDSDNNLPALRERARIAMDYWRSNLELIIQKGIERQEIRPETDIDAFIILFISTLEGAIMLSTLYDEMRYILRAIEHVHTFIDAIALPIN